MRKVFYALIILELLSLNVSHVTFTNLKCGTYNRKVAEFQKCYIKAVNRTHKYVDVYMKVNQIPLDNITLNLKVMRYDQGYKPFFIDITFDGCQFLKSQKNPIIKFFYEVYKDNSNINHTCPINHDIIVDHVWTGNIEAGISKYVPVINGDYSIETIFYSNKRRFGFVNAYVRLSGRPKDI
ncbi:uncharacterized protein Dana_GF20070 [Drosophila ananassae]|uniref:MD-2-related lipid-recognition domain-containing protein n=1 Tax=Drosophila ananassae TaxID=7217 RepID=A0A0P8XUD8_DROAN|nr:uncharacterized protein LOC6502793 isoform X2 [Drosophila ananassae]KPU78337.1 uncharacterized protein Dana_GF20070 [Drosophila ananassae]